MPYGDTDLSQHWLTRTNADLVFFWHSFQGNAYLNTHEINPHAVFNSLALGDLAIILKL